MKIFVLLGVAFLCITSVLGQTAENWRELSFGVTTPADAVKLYGKPSKDRLENQKSVLDSSNQPMTIRSLVYEKINGLNKLDLMFANDKLFSIVQYPKNKTIAAADIPVKFGSEFLFLEGLPKRFDFAQLEGQKETTVPKVYPAAYYMLSVKSDRIIFVFVNNNSFKAIWREGIKKPTLEMFPGYVESIQVHARQIEKH